MDFDVVIVGMGPVGAVAANLAGMWGLKTLVVDKLHDIFEKPRAIGLDHEAIRVFGNIGIMDKIADAVMPYRTTEYQTTGSHVLKRIAPASSPYLLGWAPNYVFDQPSVERALRENLSLLPNVNVELGTEVISVVQEGKHSAIRLKTGTGVERVVMTRFVLACDGGTSPLRTALGLEMEDLVFDEPWMVVDVRVKPEVIERLPATNVQFCEVQRPCTYIVGPGVHRRWEFMINSDESPDDIQQAESIRKLLSRWLAPDEYELWRASTYRFHALVLKKWRQGALFFLGDAAHMTPPFMAQGMVQGIRDASNLIWKLALVKQGVATESLLDTYQEERIPHVRQTTLVAKELGMVICERDPAKAAKRDEMMLAEMAKSTGPTIRQSLIPGLTTGLLAPIGPDNVRGTIFPQPLVENSAGLVGLLDEFTGTQFRVVAASDVDLSSLEKEVSSWADGTASLITLTKVIGDADGNLKSTGDYREKQGVLRDWLAKQGCKIVVVRPDHYVYGGANTAAEGVTLLQALHQSLHKSTQDRKAASDAIEVA